MQTMSHSRSTRARIALATLALVAAPVARAAGGFAPGEQIDFTIDYLGIRTGEARILVGQAEGPVWPVIARARTDGLASIVDIREHLVSYWDSEARLPRGSDLQAVELGDLRENSEYKAALERQQFVQARLGQLYQRLHQLSQLANTETPNDRVGLGSKITVLDLESQDKEYYVLVFGEMADIDLGHITFASPLGRALKDGKVGDEVDLRLPHSTRRLRIVELETVVASRE